MRASAAVPVLLCAIASSLGAQESRFAIVPAFGYHMFSPLFEHRYVAMHPEMGEMRRFEKLEIDETTSIGAAVSWRMAGPWLLYGEARRGESGYHYQRRESTGDASAERQAWSDVVLTTYEAGLGRLLRLGPGRPDVEARIGAIMSRARVGRGQQDCSSSGPFLPVQCTPVHWEGQYDMPGVTGSLEVGQRIASRVGVRLGAGYVLGRANTRRFHDDYPPEYDHLEAPTSVRVGTLRFSAGVSVGL